MKTFNMPNPPHDSHVSEIEERAIQLAHHAGSILSKHFDTILQVEYKDVVTRDPVTNVDKEIQEFLIREISEHYPEHGVIGEEKPNEGHSPAPEWVWVLDPLDGTKNFLYGLPLFACSIGVLYRGVPIVGSLYISWPNEAGGIVIHARTGGGAFSQDKRMSVLQSETQQAGYLASLPGVFNSTYRIRKSMRNKIGDSRVTGSIAFDIAMTAKGGFQYSIINAPRIWDVAGAVVVLKEAGGEIMVASQTNGIKTILSSGLDWSPLVSFTSEWHNGITSLQDLRQWSAPLVCGSTKKVKEITDSLIKKKHLRQN